MKKIDAVKMVRNIRNKQNAEIADKSPQEIIDYFRRKAGKVVSKTTRSEVVAPSA